METSQVNDSHETSDEESKLADRMILPLFLINLDRSADRLKMMIDQFSKYHVNFTRISAVDGFNLTTESFKFNIEKSRETRAGAIGCTLSHLKAIYTASQMGLDSVIIMEDDMDISVMEKWPPGCNYKSIAENAPPDWEIIQTYTSNMAMIEECYQIPNRYIKRDNRAWSTGTYIIHKRGIDKTLKKYYDKESDTFKIGGYITADMLIYDDMITYLYTTPTVCTNDYLFQSTISPKHDEHGVASSRYIRKYYGLPLPPEPPQPEPPRLENTQELLKSKNAIVAVFEKMQKEKQAQKQKKEQEQTKQQTKQQEQTQEQEQKQGQEQKQEQKQGQEQKQDAEECQQSPIFEILDASYWTPKVCIDITNELREKIVNDRLEIIASNKIKGDPEPGVVKNLSVTYKLGVSIIKIVVRECAQISLPVSM